MHTTFTFRDRAELAAHEMPAPVSQPKETAVERGERAPRKDWLAYTPLDTSLLQAKAADHPRIRFGLDYNLGQLTEKTAERFMTRLCADVDPVKGVELTVAYSRAENWVCVRAMCNGTVDTASCPLDTSTVVVYTNPWVDKKSYLPLVPDDKKVVVVVSAVFDDMRAMIESPVHHVVFAGKFPEEVRTEVIPELRSKGIHVGFWEEHVKFV